MDNNELLIIFLAFVVGYMCSGLIKNMCGGRSVEAIVRHNVTTTPGGTTTPATTTIPALTDAELKRAKRKPYCYYCGKCPYSGYGTEYTDNPCPSQCKAVKHETCGFAGTGTKWKCICDDRTLSQKVARCKGNTDPRDAECELHGHAGSTTGWKDVDYAAVPSDGRVVGHVKEP